MASGEEVAEVEVEEEEEEEKEEEPKGKRATLKTLPGSATIQIGYDTSIV